MFDKAGMSKNHRERVPREVDALAFMDSHPEDHLIRIYQVVECKYSRDKPWVVFVSPHSRIAAPACAAQSIGSEYGQTIMWMLAGEKTVRNLELFTSPAMPGFNGREAFSKGNDRFYGAMQSVTDCSRLLAEGYDHPPRQKGSIPLCCIVTFPVILIDGRLFEVYFCIKEQETKVREVSHVRCHWRGSSAWHLHATIDIITLEYFDEFCGTRAKSVKTLLGQITKAHERVKACFEDHSLDTLAIQSASRGIIGMPPLLREALQQK